MYLSDYILSRRFPNSSAFELGFIGGLNFSCAMLVAPLVTRLTRQLGLRSVMVAGCLLQAIGYLTAPLASRLWHLYLTQGALVGVGIGCMVIPSTAALSQWFSARRSIANGIGSAGSGIGGAVFTWGTAAAIRHVGVDWALRITGLVALSTTLAATFVVRDRNAHVQPSQLAFDVSLLRRPDVVLLLLWVFVSMFGYVALLFSLSDFAIAVGLSRDQATDIVGLLNVGTAVGRPLIGAVSDRYSRTATAGVLTVACGVLCFAVWLPASSFAATAAFAVPCGAVVGVFWMVGLRLGAVRISWRSIALRVYRADSLFVFGGISDNRPPGCRDRGPQASPVRAVSCLGYHGSPHHM